MIPGWHRMHSRWKEEEEEEEWIALERCWRVRYRLVLAIDAIVLGLGREVYGMA